MPFMKARGQHSSTHRLPQKSFFASGHSGKSSMVNKILGRKMHRILHSPDKLEIEAKGGKGAEGRGQGAGGDYTEMKKRGEFIKHKNNVQ